MTRPFLLGRLRWFRRPSSAERVRPDLTGGEAPVQPRRGRSVEWPSGS